MANTTAARWNTLHDLALLYVALTHSASAPPESAETATVFDSLTERFPEASPDEINEAMQEAMLAFLSLSGEHMLEIAVVSLRKQLEVEQRLSILDDLASLATADGNLVPAEASFLQQLARRWEVEQERSR